ncbi:MAG: hypothetical protein K6G80_06000 [Treponema sp.]|nr:hypothetical protein [Treponema sp.]
MKKVLGAAIIAALVGSTVANAMDYRIGVNVQSDGAWSPLTFRTSDYSYDKAVDAHVLESNGEAVSYAGTGYTVPVGDAQVLDPNGYGYAGTYQDGFSFWGGGLKVRRFEPMFQGASNTGDWKFGARFMIKNKEYDAFEGNGWSAWLDYKNFEVKAAVTGGMGYGAYCGTGGNFLLATAGLYAWLMTPSGGPAYFRHYAKGSVEDYQYFGYQVSNAGLPVENIVDNSKAVGIQWTQKVRGGQDTLNLRLVNTRNTQSGGIGYKAGNEYDTTYPVGWNAQVNYRTPKWTFSGTYKMRAANSVTADKYDYPKAFNIAGHFGVATGIIPGISLSAGYAFIGEEIGESGESEVNGVSYSQEFWGHNFGVNVGWKIGDWSFDAGNTTTLMLLSDFMKAYSNANRYGWKPYLGTSLTVNAHRRINGLLNGHISFGFTDANMNSYTDGKGEAELWLRPNVDISPARGVNINIAVNGALSNFSDQAIGWWSDYNGDSDYGKNKGEVYYTYPHTLTISIPISFRFSI